MVSRPTALLIDIMVQAVLAGPNHNSPLDRPFTLHNPEPGALELEHARQIRSGGPLTFIFPRPCVSEVDSSRVCGDSSRFRLIDSSRSRLLQIAPLADIEYRRLDENIGSLDFGLQADGHSGPVSFYVDARMFTEAHEDPFHPSFDREFVERQDERASGTTAYSSYSRYRSNFSYDMSWGRLTVARDAAHWGPGLFSNLVFNQNSIPFNQLTFTTHLGPLSVQSLYGQLALDQNWEGDSTGEHRSVYAHRYEWRAARNLLFGISEQLMLHKAEAPFAFVPVVPLYIAKAAEKEQLNNGNIAGDFLYRIRGVGSVYSEFLIDDIQSPATLFDDNWGNKWAWMFGIHGVRELGPGTAGLVAEYSRVEPWVYTHKVLRGSQTAHFDHPLGNQLGPNSQAFILKAYLRRESAWYVSARMDLTWKGTDQGSSLLDIQRTEEDKIFLNGIGSPDVRFEPYAWVRWRWLGVFARLGLGEDVEGVAGINFRY